MSSQMTKDITENSMDFIQSQIAAKNSSVPYYANTSIVQRSITDMDVFPYTRFFRGKPDDPNPNVFEREAGFRNHYQASYTPDVKLPPAPAPNICFQPACSTIFPCLATSDRNVAREQRNRDINSQIGYNISI